jgi:hypothetical protein
MIVATTKQRFRFVLILDAGYSANFREDHRLLRFIISSNRSTA